MVDWQRRVGRAIGLTAGAVAAGATAVVAGGAVLARMAVTPEREPETPVTVVRLERRGSATVIWVRGRGADLPGQYSFIFDGDAGRARFGPVIGRSGGAYLREVRRVDRGELRTGARGRLTGWWYDSPEELGYRTERIVYETELGEAEAWIVHPQRSRKKRWAVHVHGRGAPLEETLRGVAPLARAGITNLIISYRNDPGAPLGGHGRYGIGVSEARDVDAAVDEAVRRGAERVTLVGWSMGGTACLVAATRGAHRDVIDGLILDSPAVDWNELLRYHAVGKRAPRVLADVGMEMLSRGTVRAGESRGIALRSLVPEVFGRDLEVPVFIHASEGDTFVPCSGAQRLAEERPDLVQLRLVEEAEHVRIWNADRDGWENTTEQFARALPRPAWRG